MASIEDLKKIFLFKKLSDKDLEQILLITRLHEFEEQEAVFREGDRADAFYMLKRGKVLLEVDISDMISISIASVKPGFSFGWSALIPDSFYTSHAICAEPSEVLSIIGMEFIDLLRRDHAMGYYIMEGLVRIIQNRLERRTAQFLMLMSKHPDIQKLL
ncbi:MAG: cyclic nucleotide-binding domain-containing protein [Desulfobacterales bacterium]|nr:MAG: cyclic nucleotide-binding domain-containing protein [Desulfobacterales bacterium]